MYAYFLRVQLVCLNALRNKQASVRLRTTAAVNQPVWTLGMTKTVGDSLTPVINEVHQNFCSHPRFCSSTIVWSSAPPRRVTHVLEWSVKLIGKLVVTLSAERSNTASLIDLLTRIQFHCFFLNIWFHKGPHSMKSPWPKKRLGIWKIKTQAFCSVVMT